MFSGPAMQLYGCIVKVYLQPSHLCLPSPPTYFVSSIFWNLPRELVWFGLVSMIIWDSLSSLSLSNSPSTLSPLSSIPPLCCWTMLEGANLPASTLHCDADPSLHHPRPARTTMGGQNDGKFCWPAHHRLPLVIFILCQMVPSAALRWP